MAVSAKKCDAYLAFPARVSGRAPGYGLPPLGILSIASVANKNGIHTKVIDGEIAGFHPSYQAQIISKAQPKIVGISAMTTQVSAAFELAAQVRNGCPDAFIVLGGAHANSTGHGDIDRCDAFDGVLLGEGEYSFTQLAKLVLDGKQPKDVPGYLSRGQDPQSLAPVVPIENVNALPTLDFDLVDYRRYRMHYTSKKPILCTLAGRGCPYSCTFCDAYKTHGRKVRHKDARLFVDELNEQVKRFGFRYIAFKDSTFTVDKKWVMEFCEAMIQCGPKIGWSCNTRVDRVDDEMFKMMKTAGWSHVLFGVESGAEKVLLEYGKKTTIDQIRKAHESAAGLGIHVHSTYMFGSLSETKAQADKTIALACSLPGWTADFNYVTGFPGTKIYAEAVAKGRIRKNWWLPKAGARTPFEGSRWIDESTGKIDAGYDTKKVMKQAYLKFYLRPTFFARVFKMLFSNPGMLVHVWNLGLHFMGNMLLGKSQNEQPINRQS